jgi:hypothetical protein
MIRVLRKGLWVWGEKGCLISTALLPIRELVEEWVLGLMTPKIDAAGGFWDVNF